MRSGSSAWLECLPVTQEVAGSSPVRSATTSLTDLMVGFFVLKGYEVLDIKP